MRFGLPVVFGVVALGLVCAGAVLRCTAPEPELRPAAGLEPLAVGTYRVREISDRPRAELTGLVEARRLVELFVEGAGQVLETGAEALDRVEADQLLARIDPVTAEVMVSSAEASLARAQSQLALARASLTRQRQLAGNAVTSEQILEEAENAERVAVATLNEARAALRDSRSQLAKRTIRAAFPGVLREFTVEEGEYVHVGQKIGELLETSSVRIIVGLSDREVVAVRGGDSARVLVEARPSERFQGSIARIAGASDAQTGKFPVQIEIPNPDERLLPGMVARVVFELGDARPRLLVPRDAILKEYGLHYAYALESDGTGGWLARRRAVEVRSIPFQPTLLEVISGLSPGEDLAVTQLRQLREGMALRPRAELAVSGAPDGVHPQ